MRLAADPSRRPVSPRHTRPRPSRATAPRLAPHVLGGEALATLHLDADTLALAVDYDLRRSARWLVDALADAMDGVRRRGR